MKIFHLPDLGEGLAEAEIREWYVVEGDFVRVDQPLLSVETAKAVVDVPSPYTGRIMKRHGKAHEMIKTHALLVEFESEERLSNKKDRGSIVGQLEESQYTLQEESAIVGVAVSPSASLKVLPAARALAKQLHVDLKTVVPGGTNGQITVEDVKQHAEKTAPTAIAGQALYGARRAMAVTLMQAHQEVAQMTIMDDVDIGHLSADMDMTVVLLQAMVAGMHAEPQLNAWFNGKSLERQFAAEINIGLAIDTPEGLFVPVLKNVERYSTKELREKINHFKKNARSRHILPADMQGATITLSNFGTIAGRYATPLVVPPMVAILGCGCIYESVVVRDEKITATRLLPLSLSADHRAVTGGEAARFLAAIIKCIQKTT